MSEENKCTEMSATADCMVVEHTSEKKNMYKEIPAAIDAMIEHKSMAKLLQVIEDCTAMSDFYKYCYSRVPCDFFNDVEMSIPRLVIRRIVPEFKDVDANGKIFM